MGLLATVCSLKNPLDFTHNRLRHVGLRRVHHVCEQTGALGINKTVVDVYKIIIVSCVPNEVGTWSHKTMPRAVQPNAENGHKTKQ